MDLRILIVGLLLYFCAADAQNSSTIITLPELFPGPRKLIEKLTARGQCGVPSSVIAKLERVRCPYDGPTKSLLKGRVHEVRCCAKTTYNFERDWSKGGNYLQTYLEKMYLWHCNELIRICHRQTFSGFSEYAKLSQIYYCDHVNFRRVCTPQLSLVRGLPSNTSWDDASSGFIPSQLHTEDIFKPCIQVAAYHSESGGYGYFHDVVMTFVPFCHMTMSGYDAKTIEEKGLSTWTCLPSRCQTNLIIACVFCALLALAIVLANITVIAVFTSSPKLRNSQAVYKISLAIADLLVGIFVIPTFISSLSILYQSSPIMGSVIKNGPTNREGTPKRSPAGLLLDNFSPEYLNFVGFFTSLSLLVSMYTLMMASCDRFMAIYQPLRYGRHNAKKIAKWTSLILWVFAIFVSAIPFFVPVFKYGIIASIMVGTHGELGLIFYGAVIAIPLILVWITTLATYISTKRHARRRQNLTVRRSNSGGSNTASNMEARLAKTLASMVGIFTLCLLPPVVLILIPFFVNKVYPECIDQFDPQASHIYVSMEFVSIILLMTNSLWNCFIYNARSEGFKSTVKRLYRKALLKIGFRYVWSRTRSWASSTVRSGRTNAPSGRPSLRTMVSKSSLRTVSSDQGNGNGQYPSNENGNSCHSPTKTQITETKHTFNEFPIKESTERVNEAFDAPVYQEIDEVKNITDAV